MNSSSASTKTCQTIRILLLMLSVYKAIDYEQFLFSSKIRGEERKARACDRDMPSRELQVGRASPLSRHALSHAFTPLGCLFPQGFSKKRETARSLRKPGWGGGGGGG